MKLPRYLFHFPSYYDLAFICCKTSHSKLFSFSNISTPGILFDLICLLGLTQKDK